jgi:aspartyl-tRNA(Asn)/glutamyl-tRNA(Gln) amidotransferase subunit B
MARFRAYQDELGRSEAEADVLSGDRLTARIYDEARTAHHDVDSVTRWMVNDVLALLKDRDEETCKLTGAHVADVIAMVELDTISARAAKQVLEALTEQGGNATQVVEQLGLTQITDTEALTGHVRAALEAHPDRVEAYRQGRTSLMGFFIGQVMKDTGGRADPKAVSQLVAQQLNS